MSNLRSVLGSRITKPRSSPAPKKATPARKRPSGPALDESDNERLEDMGVVKILHEDLTLRDVVQAMRHILNNTFSPVPTKFPSTKSTRLLLFRASMPPMVTMSHLHAVLSPPSAVEREVADLCRRGVLRKIRVESRGPVGEGIIEAGKLYDLVRLSEILDDETKEMFVKFLKANLMTHELSTEKGGISQSQADALIRAGFLTSSSTSARKSHGSLRLRPGDKNTLTSIHHISRQSSGTLSAVGGPEALTLSGLTGTPPPLSRPQTGETYRVAVPGHARHMELSAQAVEWIVDMLRGTKFGECTEDKLRERFEGGDLYGTRWKEFEGVEWKWALGEAVGLGFAEVFDTGSVGRGVRGL